MYTKGRGRKWRSVGDWVCGSFIKYHDLKDAIVHISLSGLECHRKILQDLNLSFQKDKDKKKILDVL